MVLPKDEEDDQECMEEDYYFEDGETAITIPVGVPDASR